MIDSAYDVTDALIGRGRVTSLSTQADSCQTWHQKSRISRQLSSFTTETNLFWFLRLVRTLSVLYSWLTVFVTSLMSWLTADTCWRDVTQTDWFDICQSRLSCQKIMSIILLRAHRKQRNNSESLCVNSESLCVQSYELLKCHKVFCIHEMS